MIVHIDVQEWYPVLAVSDTGKPHDLPDDLAQQLLDATAAFEQAQHLVRAYLAAVKRDEQAYKRPAEVALARVQRGRRRHFRRSRPTVQEPS